MVPRAALIIVLALAASCGQGPAAVSQGAKPTATSSSRAAFEHDGVLVAGTEISADDPLTLVLTLGRRLPAGSQIAISFPTAVQEETDALWSIPTVEQGQPGSILLGGPARDSVAVAEAGRADGGAGRVVLRAARVLEAGDAVRLGLTGQVPQIVPRHPFRIWEIDGTDGSIAELPADNVALPPVVAAPAVTVLAAIRSDLVTGERTSMRLAALDQYGNVDAQFRGRVTFASDFAGCPPDYVFTEADHGLHTIDGLVAGAPGYRRVAARAEVAGGERDVASNPVLVSASKPQYRHFFGDPHFHSGSDVASLATPGGDHRGQFVSADDAFAFLRDVVALDWGASAEHDTGLSKETWLADQKRVDAFNDPGRFVTLIGYEWTPPRRLGHHVVLFEGGASEKNPLVGASAGKRGGAGAASLEDLLQSLRFSQHGEGRVLVIPHVMQPFPNGDLDKEDHDQPHEIWDGPPGAKPSTYLAGDLRRVGEIYSHHNDDFTEGDYRQTQRGHGEAVNQPQLFELGVSNPWSYQHAWVKGHRIGVIGGSDNHLGTPGLNDYAPTVQQHAGLAVVLAADLTRAAIFDALYNRRCYATTGPRILLDFTVAGEQMGSEFFRKDGATIPVAFSVAGTGPLGSVEVLKLVGGDFTTIKTVAGDGAATTATATFSDKLDGPTIYYVRVKQADGEMAWSSPIWVNVTYE